MFVGDKSSFAIESEVSRIFAAPGQRGLGYFVLYVSGHCFGVRDAEATMLACSLDSVLKRFERRGRHRFPLADKQTAAQVVATFVAAELSKGSTNTADSGETLKAFLDDLYSAGIVWAPDGDAAFDDSSYVFQFDTELEVRIIAFKHREDIAGTLSSIAEVRIESEIFYGILEAWSEGFLSFWGRHIVQTSEYE
jgi:hypothetical protein